MNGYIYINIQRIYNKINNLYLYMVLELYFKNILTKKEKKYYFII